jgi:hypothetical protein
VLDSVTREVLLTGEARTVRLGERLWTVALTARTGIGLSWGQLCEYDVDFPDLGSNLRNAGLLDDPVPGSAVSKQGRVTLRYPGFELPSFVSLPPDLNRLRLLHGSCRKPHGEGRDALATMDYILERSAREPSKRPQVAFHTGDQIYADDVADALLHELIETGATLFAWPGGEILPGPGGEDLWQSKPSELAPGRRALLGERDAGLTGMIPGEPNKTKSHLMAFTEFATMHLYAWSAALWPAEFEPFERLHSAEDATLGISRARYEQELQRLTEFRRTVPNVQRALANIVSYMICDDHEVTDDWYFNLEWCRRVLPKPLGRAVLRNALLAYGIFQAWGNTPEQFEEGTPGDRLLHAACAWSRRGGAPDPCIESLLSIPKLDELEAMEEPGLRHTEGGLDWHYALEGPENRYSFMVLDIRTWRGFPGQSTDPSELIDEAGLQAQLSVLPRVARDGLLVLISPNPVMGVPVMQAVQAMQNDFRSRLAMDVEYWKAQDAGFETLLAELACHTKPEADSSLKQRIVILSGDVHFGYAAFLRYWATQPYGWDTSCRVRAIFAQVNASPFKNQTTEGFASTYALHKQGYTPYFLGEPITAKHHWLGWNRPPNSGALTVGTTRPGLFRRRQPFELHETPALVEPDQVKRLDLTLEPDWEYVTQYVASSAAEYRGSDAQRYLSQAGAAALNEGQEIVGINNLGEITFRWEEGDDKHVAQDSWWHWGDAPVPYPLSRFVIPLRVDDAPPER